MCLNDRALIFLKAKQNSQLAETLANAFFLKMSKKLQAFINVCFFATCLRNSSKLTKQSQRIVDTNTLSKILLSFSVSYHWLLIILGEGFIFLLNYILIKSVHHLSLFRSASEWLQKRRTVPQMTAAVIVTVSYVLSLSPIYIHCRSSCLHRSVEMDVSSCLLSIAN